MSIGRRIIRARKAAGLSQDELAVQIGVTRPAVAQWEAGGGLRPHRLAALAEALHVDPVWLQYGTGQQKSARMPVRGEVAAGIWREAIEVDMEPIPVSPAANYPAEAQYALLVRGNSLNKIAADSWYLHVLDCYAAKTEPRIGDVVVVHRHRHGVTEATVKRLADRAGQLVLRGESTDPRYQGELPLGTTDEGTEITITAIVLGAYTSIPRGPA